jgi:hypothetical protein
MAVWQRIADGTTNALAKVRAPASITTADNAVATHDAAVSAKLPTLGPQASAASLSVVPSSSGFPVEATLVTTGIALNEGFNTATAIAVDAAVASTSLVAVTTGERRVMGTNNSTAICYVNIGAAASTTAFVFKLLPGDALPIEYRDKPALYGYWEAANGKFVGVALTNT